MFSHVSDRTPFGTQESVSGFGSVSGGLGCMGWPGVAWHGLARPGTAWGGLAQKFAPVASPFSFHSFERKDFSVTLDRGSADNLGLKAKPLIFSGP